MTVVPGMIEVVGQGGRYAAFRALSVVSLLTSGVLSADPTPPGQSPGTEAGTASLVVLVVGGTVALLALVAIVLTVRWRSRRHAASEEGRGRTRGKTQEGKSHT